MLLESLKHPASCFVTLTYDEARLPKDGCVLKRHMQLFLKRLRKAVVPRKLRYYAVGEYGDATKRPHYHAIVFGLYPTEEEVVRKCWPFGFVKCGTAEARSMSYVASYVMKKATKDGAPMLGGRSPEFCLMSRKPGLGTSALDEMVKSYMSESGEAKLKSEGYPVSRFRSSGKMYPLGRYLHLKLAEKLGLAKEDRQAYNVYGMIEVYERKVSEGYSGYEDRRKSRLVAEAGRYQSRVRAKTL